jgi:hypothetical protein
MLPDSLTIISKYDEKISSLIIQLDKFLIAELKSIIEIPDPSANIIGYGYGSGYKDSICVIIPSKKGVKLGFYKGTQLLDPTKILTGSGKVHKYVEIKSVDDIKNPALKNLLKQAVKRNKNQ